MISKKEIKLHLLERAQGKRKNGGEKGGKKKGELNVNSWLVYVTGRACN